MMDLSSLDVVTYIKVIRWLREEMARQLSKAMFKEAINTEKLIHAFEKKVREANIICL